MKSIVKESIWENEMNREKRLHQTIDSKVTQWTYTYTQNSEFFFFISFEENHSFSLIFQFICTLTKTQEVYIALGNYLFFFVRRANCKQNETRNERIKNNKIMEYFCAYLYI